MEKSRARFYALHVLFTVGLLAGRCDLGAQEKNFLWKVASDKGSVYLLGSIHLLKSQDAKLKPIIDETFNKSQRLAFEVDLTQENPEQIQKLIWQKGINLDGKTLQQKVSQETFQSATVWANDLGIDIKVLNPLKPWLAGLTLTVMTLQKLGYNPESGIDRQLARRAKLANKPVSGLETHESQFDVFDRLTPALQEMMLRQSLKEVEQIGGMVDDMVRAWRDGDIVAAEKLFLGSMKEFPEIREKLLDERNRNWLPQIEKFIASGEATLVVVGAAHMVGKNGIIELLKARGYKLEQM